MGKPIISARNIKKSFGQAQALRGVSLDVMAGEVLAIMGPSGSGKSTLLHSLAAIIGVDSGEIHFDGHRIDVMNDDKRSILRRTRFGFVFQFLDNVALPLLLNGAKRQEAYKQAEHWLKAVGLSDKAGSMLGELSGGQMQRVAIARAMVTNPTVLFADEPTGSLDSLNSEKITELFIATAKEHGTTVIMVTHEPTIAAYADREIIVRDGQIASAGHVQSVSSDAHSRRVI